MKNKFIKSGLISVLALSAGLMLTGCNNSNYNSAKQSSVSKSDKMTKDFVYVLKPTKKTEFKSVNNKAVAKVPKQIYVAGSKTVDMYKSQSDFKISKFKYLLNNSGTVTLLPTQVKKNTSDTKSDDFKVTHDPVVINLSDFDISQKMTANYSTLSKSKNVFVPMQQNAIK